jgi:hypothetical protein
LSTIKYQKSNFKLCNELQGFKFFTLFWYLNSVQRPF